LKIIQQLYLNNETKVLVSKQITRWCTYYKWCDERRLSYYEQVSYLV